MDYEPVCLILYNFSDLLVRCSPTRNYLIIKLLDVLNSSHPKITLTFHSLTVKHWHHTIIYEIHFCLSVCVFLCPVTPPRWSKVQ